MDNRIRELRNERGLTQQQLAELVNVSSRTIISLEKGQYNPSVLLAYKMAFIFECAIEQVFVFGEEDTP
ncbi:helix-turn-helix transcriptional regulator [Methanogenium sp. S4BF]|uniref:helix-turn-helix transcriptional regulator n=1 Tax=Methanogenium sp. S4BF TaxID=1789226 RepID=UPI0024179696|nr:helix-turn-helix transcriptional regulator [Methanogenium sp. S4BF]WFN33860.1 helix-turn-helix transcriptional regulator [Methanogenium sp. S4BF]